MLFMPKITYPLQGPKEETMFDELVCGLPLGFYAVEENVYLTKEAFAYHCVSEERKENKPTK